MFVNIPFIEEYVAETCTDDSAGDGPHEEYAEPFLGGAFVTIDARLYFVADKESYHEGETVPTDGEWSYMKPHRVGCPCDEIKHFSLI